jgi:putative ATPase
MPEGNLALAEAVVYLATAPKSNSLYTAYTKVQEEVKEGATTSVPLHLRNPVTKVMKDLDYGKDYKYAHNFPDHFVEQQNLPDALKGKKFYTPSEQGYEKTVLGRLKTWWGRKEKPEEKPESKADG